MKKLTSTVWGVAIVAALALTQFASAQSWIGTLTGTNQNPASYSFWTNTANWSGGVIPNATDAIVTFSNGNVPIIYWETNVTVGRINLSNSVVMGVVTNNNDVLTLSTSTGTPILDIASGATLTMYATLAGSQGFIKTNSGLLSMRYSTNDNTFTGNVTLGGGTITLNQDGNLGNSANDLIFSAGSTLLFHTGGGTGGVTLGSGRSVTINSGITATINNGDSRMSSAINGVISGAGNLTFAGTGTITLNGANTYTGQTTHQGGSMILGSGASLSTNTFNWSGTNTYVLNLGANSQTNAGSVFNISPTTARTFTITNGRWVVGDGANFALSGAAGGSAVVMSGLSNFVLNAPSRAFTVTPTNNTTAQTNSIFLANTGVGSNSITASGVTVGGAAGTGAGDNHRGNLFLGTINEFNTTNFSIGGFNGSGVVEFQAGVVNGSVKLRNANGTSALGTLFVGNTSSGSRRGTGTLDLGIADALVTNTFIGNFQANGIANLTLTSAITMAGGSFASTNLYIGTITNPAATGMTITNINIFQQNGGTSAITLIRMGDTRATDAGNTIAYQSSYNLVGSGALLRAQTIDAGTNAIYGANSFRTLTMSNGATLRNASGANLSVNGFTNTAAGRIGINLAGNGTVEADSGQSVTFGGNTLVSGAGALTKTGAGTLVLQAANTHSGGTTLSAGTIEAAANTALGSGTIALNGGTLLASGAARSYTNAVSVGGNVTLGGSGNGLTFSGPVSLGGANRTLTISDNTTISGAITNGGLTKAGASTLTLSGANSYSGGTVVSAGTLVASGSGLQGAVTNDAAVILSGTGTYGGAMSGTGSLTKEGSGTYTLSGNSDFSGATTVSAGRLVVDGSSSASAVTVSSGASLGGIGEVAALTVGGTLAPGNSVGTLSAGNTTFLGGGAFELEMWDWDSTEGTGWDLLDITGNLTLSNTTGNKFNINLVSMSSATTTGLSTNFVSSSSFTNTFVTFSGSLLGTGFSAELFNVVTAAFQNPFSGTFSITNIGQTLALVYTAPTVVSSYDWNVGSGDWATTNNWTNGAAPTDGAAISFSGAGGLSTNNQVSSISGLTFNGTSGGYTVSGDALAIGTTGIDNESTNTHTVQNNISLAASATFGALSNNMIITGNVTNSGGLLTLAGPNNIDISGLVSGAGSLSKTAGGTLTLSASNSYSGGTTLSSGTIAAGDDSALGSGAVTLSGGTLAASGGARSLTNAVTINGNATLGGLGYSLTLGGAVDLAGSMRIITTTDNATLSGAVSNGGITKSGAATLTLFGANNYSGGTLVSGGVLAGNATSLQGPITNNAAVLFDQSSDGTYAGSMSGSGRLEKVGAGTLTLSGANSYNGGTLVTLGALAGSTTSLQGPITNNSSVVFSQTTNGTYSGAMTGSGSLTKLGSGTVTLSGANSYSGGSLLSAGGLVGSTTSLQGPITNNSTLEFSQSTNGTYAGAMSGTGTFTKSGAGTITLNGANTYTGTTTIGGGGVTLGTGSAISTNTLTFNGTTGLVLNLGGNSQTVGLVNNNLSNSATTLTITNGNLTINASANQAFGATVNGSGTDLSGLGNFTFNGASRVFNISATGANVTNTVQFSKLGTNTISAANVQWGGGGTNAAGQNSIIRLGQGNVINAGTEVLLGYFQGSGNVSFADGITNGTLTIRGAGGGANVTPLIRIGQANSGNQSTVGILNLTGGSIDALATEFDIATHAASTAGGAVGGTFATGTLTMPGGTIVAGTMSVGRKTASTGSPLVTATVNQSGGAVTATNLYLGNSQTTDATNAPGFTANYNLTRGTLYAQTISGNGANYAASTVRNLNLNGGTVRNISGSDLSINGLANTATGRVNIVLGGAGGTFEADSGRNITVGANSLISSTGRLNKTGQGTLTVASANTYSGGTLVSDGTIVANNNTAFGTGAVTLTNGTALAGAGQTIANDFVIGDSGVVISGGVTNTFTAYYNFGTASGDANTTTTSGGGITFGAVSQGNNFGSTTMLSTTSAGVTNPPVYTGVSGQFNAQAAAYTGVLSNGSTYFEFSLTADTDYQLSLTNFTFGTRATGTGPQLATLLSSIDGYTTALATNAIANNSAWALIAPNVVASAQTNGTVTFRIYGSAGTGSPTSGSANWRIDDLNLYGISISNIYTTNAASGSGTVGIQEAGSATYSGNFTVYNSATLTAATNGQSSFTGAFTGGASASLSKSGSGTVTLSGNNSYAGSLSVNDGILELATSGGAAAGSVASVSVASGATLLLSQSAQVNNSATVSLSGGTISRASGVSETFGALNLTDASFLDFGTGTAGNLTFGVYEDGGTPSALLTVNNFFGGNILTFGTDLSGYIDASYNGTAFTSDYFNINSTSGGFTSSWNGSTFTITAIPEPSTYLAAAGLLGLMLWPSRRRLLKDAKSILGLRAPMRDRLAQR